MTSSDVLRLCRGALVVAAAVSAASASPWSALLNSLYSPVLDPGGGGGGIPRSSLTPPPLTASFAPTYDFGFASRSAGSASASTGYASSLATAPAFSTGYGVGLRAGTPSTGFATSSYPPSGFASRSSSFLSPGSQAQTSGLTGPGGSPSRAGGKHSQVVNIAEAASKLFARTFRAFSGNPTETVKLELYTRQQATVPVRIYARNRESVEKTTFDPAKPIKILIHGFLSHQGPGSGGDMLKNAFLAVQDCNVVTVDWSAADPREYSSAVKLAMPRVAGEVAELVRLFNAMGSSLNDVHILGHSLGAQMAGAAGSQVLGPAAAGRITGLDPAGPLFEARDPAIRLDPSDAGFVDVIHTDGGQLGYVGATGHADFFPDGGMHGQPGCGKDVVGICSHCLVYDLMADALLKPGADVYRKCSSWQGYQNGECGAGDNAVMGIFTDPRSRGSYYLATNRSSVRSELRTAGDTDIVGIFMLRNNPQQVDGITLLHC